MVTAGDEPHGLPTEGPLDLAPAAYLQVVAPWGGRDEIVPVTIEPPTADVQGQSTGSGIQRPSRAHVRPSVPDHPVGSVI